MNTYDDFLSKISIMKIISSTIKESYEDWGQDIPTILLFSNIGREMARSFTDLSMEERSFLINSMETGISSSSEGLRTAIATGLLEALCNTSQASTDPNLWSTIHCNLGPRSRAYVDAWLDWQK